MNFSLTLIAQAAVFAMFIWFTAKFVWPPLMRAMSERQAKIAEGLAAAEKGAKSLSDAQEKSNEELKAARTQAQDILAAANKQASGIVDQAKEQAKSEAERILENAREEGQRETAQIKEELRKQVGDLAVLGAAKILKKEINASQHADIVKDLAAQL